MAKMTVQELKHEISKVIREMGLNEILSQGTLDEIKERIIANVNGQVTQRIVNNVPIDKPTGELPSVVNEYGTGGPIMPGGTREFPYEEAMGQLNQKDPNEGRYGIEPGGENMLDKFYEPKVATPELPDMVEQIEPGKIVVFDYGEVANEGGENLANKPLRQYDDPDIKRSMRDLWKNEGKKKVEVYVAKFEKIGDLEYDHLSGTAKFVDEQEGPEMGDLNNYQENPYTVKPTPHLERPEIPSTPTSTWNSNPNQQHSQTVKPMEEGLRMKDLAGVKTEFQKTNTPELIKESMDGDIKKGVKLLSENEEVCTWEFEGKVYHTPKKYITKNKCYIKG